MMGVEDKVDTENNDLWTHEPLKGDLPINVGVKDVTAQNHDRLLIEALLDYSDKVEDEGLIGTLFCGDWRDAVTGWGLARPNVKYAWTEKAAKERRRGTQSKKKQHEEEQSSWKNKIEPLTYKYNPDCAMPLRQAPDQLQKRQVHPSLQHHIDKVREHLERTLMKQQVLGEIIQEKKKQLEPLPKIEPRRTYLRIHEKGDGDAPNSSPVKTVGHKHGDYIVQMVQKARRHSLEGDSVISKTDSGEGDASFHRNGLGRHSDATLGQKHHTWHRQYQEPQNTKASMDLVTALGQKLNEILLEDKLKSLGGVASLPRKIQKSSLFNTSSLTNSHEHFPSTELAGDQSLNPLTKVTPYQRQVHDDNEVAVMNNSRLEKTGTANSTTSHVASLYSDYAQDESCNKDFISMGISGQCVPSKADKNQSSSKQNSVLSGNSTQHTGKKHRISGSNKLHKLPLTHNKLDSSEKPDDMHRGMMDREAAAAVAVSLMPGVRGRNIEIPNV